MMSKVRSLLLMRDCGKSAESSALFPELHHQMKVEAISISNDHATILNNSVPLRIGELHLSAPDQDLLHCVNMLFLTVSGGESQI
jgi:hypothetical protein